MGEEKKKGRKINPMQGHDQVRGEGDHLNPKVTPSWFPSEKWAGPIGKGRSQLDP